MQTTDRTNLFLGLGVVTFSLLLIFVWVPFDTTTGIAERVRRQYVIGDALAPTVAGGFLLIGGLMLLLFGRVSANTAGFDRMRTLYVACVALILATSFVIMRYTGPLSVWVANFLTDSELNYRLLRGTAPWKYIGFFLGCSFAVSSIMALTERKLTAKAVLVGVVASLALIAIYDLPFEDLLLPPNGDV